MKKFITTFIITLTVVALLFTGYVLFNQLQQVTKERDSYKEKTSEFEKKYTEIQDLVTVMTPETFQEQVKTGKKMYVYIGRPDCSDCSTFDPQLTKYIKEHKEVAQNLVFVNVRLLRADETKWTQFKKDYAVLGTPHFALWENGKQVSKSEWTKEKGYSIELFEKWCKESNLVK